MGGVGYVLESLLDLIWPRRCVVCGKMLGEDEHYLCTSCLDDIPLTWFWAWGENPAEQRLWKKIGIVSAACLYFYRNSSPYNVLVQDVKYRGNIRLGVMLGRMLGERMKSSGRFNSLQAVVCIPLHPLRKWKRGYNQAEVEARGIAGALGIPLETNLLKRRRYTRTQTKLKGDEAKGRNVKDAFALNESAARRLEAEGICHILLVDDTLTSGATIAEAAGMLSPRFLVSVAAMAFVE